MNYLPVNHGRPVRANEDIFRREIPMHKPSRSCGASVFNQSLEVCSQFRLPGSGRHVIGVESECLKELTWPIPCQLTDSILIVEGASG